MKSSHEIILYILLKTNQQGLRKLYYFKLRKCCIPRLSDCNGTRTHNHLVRKRTLNHLAKLAK